MKRTVFATLVLTMIAALALFLIGCGGGGASESGDGYKIENQKLVNKDGNAYVSGKLTNTSDGQHDILVSWYAYDSGKNGIGVAEFNANMIKPKETYDFEVAFEDAKGEKVRFDEVKQFLFAEAHFTDVEHQEYLDNLGQKDKGDGFTIKNQEMLEDSRGDVYIKGKFVNESGKRLSQVYLWWKLLDKNGKQCGEASVLIDKSIEAGETIDFKSETSLPTDVNGKYKTGDVSKATVKSFKFDNENTTVI